MKICFMGTPEFAVPSLEALYKKYEIVGVFTQPDKPKGRGKKLMPPPVKIAAQSLGIKVYQPAKIKSEEAFNIVLSLNADLIVVVAYGQILPKAILDMPKFGAINVHASLLPKYRGAAPIQWAIINGEQTTGVTIMQMDTGMDTGGIILQKSLATNNRTSGEMFPLIATLGAHALIDSLKILLNGSIKIQLQDDNIATYAPMLEKKHGNIDWNKSCTEIINLINGLNPWPGAYTSLNCQVLKIWRAKQINIEDPKQPGTLLASDPKQGIIIKTKDGALYLTEVQLKSGKRLNSKEFTNGNKFEIGIKAY